MRHMKEKHFIYFFKLEKFKCFYINNCCNGQEFPLQTVTKTALSVINSFTETTFTFIQIEIFFLMMAMKSEMLSRLF